MALVSGTLNDFGLESLDGFAPKLIFRPSGPGLSGIAVLASKAVEVVPAANGYFEVDLAPTVEVSPPIQYVIQLRWLEMYPSRKERVETLPWKLEVPAAGGYLSDLLKTPSNPALAWSGEEPPANPTPGTWWLRPSNAELSEFSATTGWTHKADLRGPAGYNATDAAGDDAAVAAFVKATAGPTATRDAVKAVANTIGKAATLYADFSALTVRPSVADTGQPFGWGYTGKDNIVMIDGLMYNTGTAGQYYVDAKIDGPVTGVGVEMVFFAGAASGMVYGSWAGSVTATNGWSGQKSRCHVILYPDRVEYYVNATGAAPAAVLIKTQTLPAPLTQHADNAAWNAAGRPTNKAVTIMAGDTAVTIVNGVALPPISHPGIAGGDLWPFWEAYKPVVGVKAVWALTTPEHATASSAGALSQAVAAAQKKADDAYAASPAQVVRLEPQAFSIRTGAPSLGMNGLDVPCWAFDQAAVENVRGFATVPAGWSTYDVVLVSANPTAAAGDVRMQVQIHLVGNDGAAIYGTNQTSPAVAYTAPAQGIRKDLTVASNVARAASGQILVTISRVASDATDTLAADYAVARVELRKKS